MNGAQFEAFLAWFNEQPQQRSVIIKVERHNSSPVRAFVYDTEIMAGQLVADVSEIDLLKKAEQDIYRELARLEKLKGRSEDQPSAASGQ